MLTIEKLSLNFGVNEIFNNLSLSLYSGSALIVSGRNGSGKTSLLKIIAGIIKPKQGNILWDNQDINSFRYDFNGDLRFISDKIFLKPQLTVIENLKFFSKLHDTELSLAAAINFFKLDNILDKKISKISTGMQKKVQLSLLLSCPATIWLLDEPTVHLDDFSKKQLLGLINNHIENKGIAIIVSHEIDLFKTYPILLIEDFKNDYC